MGHTCWARLSWSATQKSPSKGTATLMASSWRITCLIQPVLSSVGPVSTCLCLSCRRALSTCLCLSCVACFHGGTGTDVASNLSVSEKFFFKVMSSFIYKIQTLARCSSDNSVLHCVFTVACYVSGFRLDEVSHFFFLSKSKNWPRFVLK